MSRFNAHVEVNGRTRVLHCVEGGTDWKDRFQWAYGYYPEDHQLIRLEPAEYEKEKEC